MQKYLKLEQYPLVLQVVRKNVSRHLVNDGYVFCSLITAYINLAASLQYALSGKAFLYFHGYSCN